MRSLRAVWVVALLAGCAAPAVDDAGAWPTLLPGDVYEPVQDHDHADPALHVAVHGFEKLGWHNGYADDGTWPDGGGVNEIAVHLTRDEAGTVTARTVFLARSAPQGGFAVLDATDPTAPRLLADFDAEGLADIDLSHDGRWVFASTQRSVPAPGAVAEAPDRHTPRGVYVVDVSDPTAPRLESFHPLPVNGPHTATYAEIDGRPYVFLQTYDNTGGPTNGLVHVLPPTQRVWVTAFGPDAAGTMRLTPVGQYSILSPQDGTEWFPHDASFAVRDGRAVLTVAYWDAGVRFVDVSDPARPVEFAAFTDFHPSNEVNMHDVKTFPVLLDGKHVTVAGPELPSSNEDGQLTFIDTTDPEAPTWLGAWSLPGEHVVDQPYIFSPHVFEATETGRVYIGHYHGGVWGIDATDPADPRTEAWFMPDAVREGWTGPVPATWGVRWPGDGLLYVSDVPTGLYILRPL